MENSQLRSNLSGSSEASEEHLMRSLVDLLAAESGKSNPTISGGSHAPSVPETPVPESRVLESPTPAPVAPESPIDRTPSNNTSGRLQRILKTLQSSDDSPPSHPAPTASIPPPPNDEVEVLRQTLSQLETKFDHLQQQVYEPTELINPLLPLIHELLDDRLDNRASHSQQELCQLLAPVIDRIIREKSQQDLAGLGSAMADVIPAAIIQEVQQSPDQIAAAIAPEIASAIKKQVRLDRDAIKDALAPEMGKAIKAQIELERDAMVDALYPVIGSTISKYMAEVVRDINHKVDNALSFEGVRRKVRAKMQGVSEAELILRESMRFNVLAIFLVHKNSGLIIAEVQDASEERLESDMLAGMLTAIRSFANDCISKAGNTSELNEIEYEDVQIILEVAGYCYLATIIRGEPNKAFIEQMRETLSILVQKFDEPIQTFDGNPASVPEPVPRLLQKLMQHAETPASKTSPTQSRPVLLILLGLLAAAGVGFAAWSAYHQHIERQALAALDRTPELALYRLDVVAQQGKLQLLGKLPSEELRLRAAQIVRAQFPQWQIDNAIVPVKLSPDPAFVRAEVQRFVALFDRMESVTIEGKYIDNRVIVQGQIDDRAVAQQLVQSLESIPGVDSVVLTLAVQDLTPIGNIRIYFEQGSSRPKSADVQVHLASVRQLLASHPTIRLKIVGHSDRSGSSRVNQLLSQQRANAVKALLVKEGIPSDRLSAVGSNVSPPEVSVERPLSLSRCVRFEIVEAVAKPQ
jgi:outer membrane protein OmpA-like peptidoglycan-associated protein